MTRRYGSPKRTTAGLKAEAETRITCSTDAALPSVTVAWLMRHGFYRHEAEARLKAERERRGMVV